jgi:hypothetical protein
LFVAISLARDVPRAVIAGFSDGPVWFFDFCLLIVRVVGVGRFVAFGIGLDFEVPITVVFVFGFM